MAVRSQNALRSSGLHAPSTASERPISNTQSDKALFVSFSRQTASDVFCSAAALSVNAIVALLIAPVKANGFFHIRVPGAGRGPRNQAGVGTSASADRVHTSASRNNSWRVASQMEHMWRAFANNRSASARGNVGKLTWSVTSNPKPPSGRSPNATALQWPASLRVRRAVRYRRLHALCLQFAPERRRGRLRE